ncbi:MAG: hypothetical protein M3357_19720 [Actinomycetota bacterium]|nr:hypothetical protein [Actinomycetota bacterium]
MWFADALLLSLGSPVIARELASDPRTAVHLESGTDVIIVEGDASIVTAPEAIAEFATRYNAKYDWEYKAEQDGPPTRIDPSTILSWRAAGEAGRGGFSQAAKWSFPH